MSEKKKILIADDDHFLLSMYTAKFQQAGYEVEPFSNPDECLKRLKEGYRPDIFLLDIMMPGMNGLELLEIIKNEKYDNDGKSVIVMLTNQSDTDQIEKAKNLGIDGYIVKATVIPSEVVEEVTNIVNSNLK